MTQTREVVNILCDLRVPHLHSSELKTSEIWGVDITPLERAFQPSYKCYTCTESMQPKQPAWHTCKRWLITGQEYTWYMH